MIPIRDTIRSRTAPVVTVALIVVNVMVFLHEIALGPYIERFVYAYGLIPRRFVYWPGAPLDPMRFLPLFTSMFWHGGWLHLIGNMLYLWIFGDNVEDRLGHLRFLLFYVFAGAAAGLTHVVLGPTSALPTVGASGAIAGVLGAYLVTFPRSRVLTFIPIFFLPWFVEIPAVVYLVFWFLMQLLQGLGSIGAPVETGGVAVWAHIGGFVAGIVLIKLMQPTRRRPRQLGVEP
ncbi:MAG: rhomboid family intramembrane serine protease [Deltaproteobacteria bacterium]|nr:MAG: rhomboid family intramembrane serine protease [Deltaproteobacteria bacterium]TMB39216.1 MAG: rhomboid family intramembrane serine protease [Deltaproteobacteria bacterium]